MNKETQFLTGFRDLYDKMIWLNNATVKNKFKGYKSSEVHCIEYIGKNIDSNVTRLAESMYMTSGALSKITKSLIKKGVIESYQQPDNKKEIYYRLTKQGDEIFKNHEEMHKEFRNRDKVIFEQLPEQQVDSMILFIKKYSRHLDDEIKKVIR